ASWKMQGLLRLQLDWRGMARLACHGRDECRALLQALPVRRGRGLEVLRQSPLRSQHKRITDHDVCRRKALRAEPVRAADSRLTRAQARQKPACVIGHDLRLAAFLRLELAIAQHQRLRKSQSSFAKMQPIQKGTVSF